MVGELSIRPGSSDCLCHWPDLCDGAGWMECLDECACQCGGMRECSGCKACRPGEKLKAPFPWFGGKSRVADMVWDRFGHVPNYVEPFFGSGAVLLGRPTPPGIETINDKDCLVANFWRALQHDPEMVAHHADHPVNEADQHARHLWLCFQQNFRERMKSDPEYYDAKIAGWWVWGQSIWIGSGWCARELPDENHMPYRQLPYLRSAGMGVHRKRPHLGNAGTGVTRRRPTMSSAGRGMEKYATLVLYMQQLADRLRHVRVCCGDWSRICSPTPTIALGTTGVFLDPPYPAEAERYPRCYRVDDLEVAHAVRDWAIEHGDYPDMRIALCGYEHQHGMPATWTEVAWKATGGYGWPSNGRGRANSARERIWFSPHCLRPQESLFYRTEDNGWEYAE